MGCTVSTVHTALWLRAAATRPALSPVTTILTDGSERKGEQQRQQDVCVPRPPPARQDVSPCSPGGPRGRRPHHRHSHVTGVLRPGAPAWPHVHSPRSRLHSDLTRRHTPTHTSHRLCHLRCAHEAGTPGHADTHTSICSGGGGRGSVEWTERGLQGSSLAGLAGAEGARARGAAGVEAGGQARTRLYDNDVREKEEFRLPCTWAQSWSWGTPEVTHFHHSANEETEAE